MDTVSIVGGRRGHRHYPFFGWETRPHTRTRTNARRHLPEPFSRSVLGWPKCAGRTRCKRCLFLHVNRGRFLRNAKDADSEVARFQSAPTANRRARACPSPCVGRDSKRPWSLGCGRFSFRSADCGGQAPALREKIGNRRMARRASACLSPCLRSFRSLMSIAPRDTMNLRSVGLNVPLLTSLPLD